MIELKIIYIPMKFQVDVTNSLEQALDTYLTTKVTNIQRLTEGLSYPIDRVCDVAVATLPTPVEFKIQLSGAR